LFIRGRGRWTILAIAVAKKTGDYSVLSHTDVCVVALAYELDLQEKERSEDSQVFFTELVPRILLRGDQVQQGREVEAMAESLDKTTLEDQQVEPPVEATAKEDTSITEVSSVSRPSSQICLTETKPAEPGSLLQTPPETPPLYEDPSDEDDGEGEWITPNNVALHKSKALQLIPAQGGINEKVITGCMTTDFAMQNVLMQMGLSLVGVDGKKIDKVKTWVLRCHACFK
jgi:RNA-binding protein NOB1